MMKYQSWYLPGNMQWFPSSAIRTNLFEVHEPGVSGLEQIDNIPLSGLDLRDSAAIALGSDHEVQSAPQL